jgi:hypothetical protein
VSLVARTSSHMRCAAEGWNLRVEEEGVGDRENVTGG